MQPVPLGLPRHETLFAHHRQQALALAQREQPPLAIVDLGLPPDPDGVSEGFATLEQLARAVPETEGDRGHQP